ncbi:MAG: chromosomal replication initiator protein DnaA [Acidimicrobiia bacterium]|nr:chromosomal replication initiator protein DnaA [Acidimicrobiia bacterium]
MPDGSASSVWDAVSGSLREQLGDAAWSAWFAPVTATSLNADRLQLAVPARLYKVKIEERYTQALHSALTHAAGRPLAFDIDVVTPPDSVLETQPSNGGSLPLATGPLPPHTVTTLTQSVAVGPPSRFTSPAPQIQPQNIFDNFIIGESNRFAHAAALAVAESPASEYNPLFIYGGTGLGKTHLLHAIVNYIRTTTNLRAIYTSSEQFTNEFIEMIRSDRRSSFRDRYRSTDILLIDDIQFLAGKVETQNEFFHTFNSLHQANKQIVIASDRPPKEIAALEDRLRTRFEWGLLTDIQPPDLETRIAILRNKSDRSGLSVPPEVLEFIAHRISDNIRELEGALNRIAAYAKLEGRPVTLDRAEDLLVGIGDVGTRQVTSDLIMRETATAYDVTVEDLVGPSRRRPLVVARQVAMYLHRELTDLSLPRIGEIFGGRDHTTVLHAQRKIAELMHQRKQLLQQVNELANRIKLG